MRPLFTMISFEREVCSDLAAATSREWLETNGLGGFASSTICGMNTRRYHGLLMAALKPPVSRTLLLSKVEETVVIAGQRFDLSVNRYPGAIHPGGHNYLRSFRLDPFPIFTYQVEDVTVEKCVFLVHGENTVVVQYNIDGDATLELRPLIAFRDFHSTTHENRELVPDLRLNSGTVSVQPYTGLPRLFFNHNAAHVDPSGDWYRNFEYSVEQERGLDFQEDLFQPFVMGFDTNEPTVIVSLEPIAADRAASLREAEVKRRASLATTPLHAAADQFIVQRGEGKTIIAGYPWFSDWGRDTMIALPGLTLATRRPEVARGILLEFAAATNQGMLPNRFPDAGETPEYNTIDATLWFFEAVRAYLKYTGDAGFVQEHILPTLISIIDWHLKGTRYGIRVDSDGLLAGGEPGVQLTWMDAKVGDWVVTPRHGKPVEIQALWYNALCIMESLVPECQRYAEHAAKTRKSFNELFWNEQAGCLFDVVNGDTRDAAIRPNQIFAVSLTHSMLPLGRSRRVVETVERELLTPMGLRTLAPSDPQYRGRYRGGVWERDSAYHQGTVWPWLMGPFITAFVKVHNRSAESRKQAAQWLAGFEPHLKTAGLGQISEVADGDAPHKPGGCFAQAWSVAELLRASLEDVGQ